MNLAPVKIVLILLLFVVLGFGVYSNTFQAPFQLDDTMRIEDNPHVRLTKITLKGIGKAAFNEKSSPNRPIANITFALNYYFHQYRVTGYHAVNIVVHILTAVLLYLFARITLLTLQSGDSKLKPRSIALYLQPLSASFIAFFSAMIWLVHPIQTQSVTYIVQRMNSMAAMFYILSLLLYVKGRLAQERTSSQGGDKGRSKDTGERGSVNALPKSRSPYLWFAGSFLAWTLALGSKQTAATLPFFILLYEWYFFQNLSNDWLKRCLKYFLGIVVLLAFISLLFLGLNPLERLQSIGDYSLNQFTFGERVLTQPRVVIYYLSLLFYPLPSRLNLDHDFPLSHSLADPITTLLSIGAIVGIIGLACYLAKKERLISFSILWFFGNLVLESSLIPLAIIYEHRTYLPSMFVSLLIVILIHRYVNLKWLQVGVLCAAVALFSLWTYQRNSVWSDDVALWKDCVEKSPKKARPNNNFALALSRQGRFEEATSYYHTALRIRPDYAEALNNLAVTLKEMGKPDEAISYYYRALGLKPHYAWAHYNLGNALLHQGRLDEAITRFSEALRLRPDIVDAYNGLGNALVRQGRLYEASSLYLEALRLKPEDEKALGKLAVVYMGQGRLNEAITHFSEALRIKPDDATLHSNLGVALVRQGRLEEAVSHFSEALRINPGDENARHNLEFAMKQMGSSGKSPSE